MNSVDRNNRNPITKRNHSQSLTSAVIPITPEVIEAGLDVINNIVDLYRDIVNVFREMERTKQLRIEAETRIAEAWIRYESDLLDFKARMAELTNQNLLIQQRGEIINETNERCNKLLAMIIQIANMPITDDPIIQDKISDRLKILADLLNSVQDSLGKL